MMRISSIEEVYQSCLREYMTGVDRTKREYKTQEIFTPDWMVDLILTEMPDYNQLDSVCLDRAVGDGQFVSKVLIGKIKYYQSYGMDIHDAFTTSLDEIFGVDIEPENVELCRKRLLCGCEDPEVINLVSRRIIIGDCLNPHQRLEGQTEQDHLLMKSYFGASIEIGEEIKLTKIPKPKVTQKKEKDKKKKFDSKIVVINMKNYKVIKLLA